jgi:hypothetical protein
MHVYLSLIPQALIASMLTPEEFGNYYAIGARATSMGESMFFEVDPEFRSDDFPFRIAQERCVPHRDGSPKKSVYLSIYRVLSRVPVSVLGSLYLTTSDGLTLGLSRGAYREDPERKLRLYQEFCPVNPMVASRLAPRAFCRFITDPSQPVHVPRIVFSQLRLNGLQTDPLHGRADDLPYRRINHLRTVLNELATNDAKQTKLVQKQVKDGPMYRMIHGGLYVGDQHDFAFYPFPGADELESLHYNWWRSAQAQPLGL